MIKKNDMMILVREYLIITFALFVLAIAWTAFLIPSEVIGGGLTGLSSLLFFVTNIPVGVISLALNVVLILIALKVMGTGFVFKTIYSTIVFSGFLVLLQVNISEAVVHDRFLSAVMGGILNGASIGLIFTQGGSSGGTDIIAMLINKKRNISPARILFTLDVIIVASSYFVFHSIENIIYGYITMGVSSYVIDLTLTGDRRSVQIFIFSKFSSQIAEAVFADIKRGVTMVKGRGWYSKEDVEVVMVVVRKKELGRVLRYIRGIDNDAFISVGNVMGVYGKGFDELKVRPLHHQEHNT